MVVIDQALKNNSYVTFYNTNVNRGKDEYMANVSGTEVRFVDKNNFSSVCVVNIHRGISVDSPADLVPYNRIWNIK